MSSIEEIEKQLADDIIKELRDNPSVSKAEKELNESYLELMLTYLNKINEITDKFSHQKTDSMITYIEVKGEITRLGNKIKSLAKKEELDINLS